VKIGVLALQGDVREHVTALAEVGAEPVEVRRPEDLSGVEAVILPGGESTTLSLLLDSSGLRDALASRLADGMPGFGTCAGMILLARVVLDGRSDQHSLGAVDIQVRRNAFGRQAESFECELDIPVIGPNPFPAVFIRAPWVESAGAGVEVLARVDGPDGMARPVLCRQGPHLVASFHPELCSDLRIHELFLSAVG
jgi:5'-phosphate synthase pdxT subunit